MSKPINTYNDSDGSPSDDAGREAYVVDPQSHIDAISGLHSMFEADAPIRTADIAKLQNRFNEIEVQFFGGTYRLNDAEFQKNAVIWKEIEEKNYRRMGEMTMLNEHVLMCLDADEASDLCLDGLTKLSHREAHLIGGMPEVLHISLDGLVFVPSDVFSAILRTPKASVSMANLKKLPKDQSTIDALRGYVGNYIDFDGLTSISDEEAKEFGLISQISLRGVHSFTKKQLHALFQKRWCYRTLGLTSLTDETAKDIASFYETSLIELPLLRSITNEQAVILAKYEGAELNLGLTSITDAQAAAFANFQGNELHLTNLTSLTPKQAKLLVPIAKKIGAQQTIHNQIKAAAS